MTPKAWRNAGHCSAHLRPTMNPQPRLPRLGLALEAPCVIAGEGDCRSHVGVETVLSTCTKIGTWIGVHENSQNW